MTGIVATAETDINASPDQVWKGLTDPEMIKEYMFGSQVETDWKQGSPIIWKGDYEGKKYEDKGEILDVVASKQLTVTHYSPLSGQKDEPANYHTLTYQLSKTGDRTHVTLSQDNNGSQDEAQHSRENWEMVLKGLKNTVEKQIR
jgi:uncharacterized protein YndB with AHSA1/START domain